MVAANQKKTAVRLAVDRINNKKHRVVARAAIEPQKKKAEQIIVAVQKAPTLPAMLKKLKELKTPLCFLRAQQTLQNLLVTGCYQKLLDTDKEKRKVLDRATPTEAYSLPTVEKMTKLIEKRLDRQEKSNTGTHLEDYIATWTQSQLTIKVKTQQEIEFEVDQMHKTGSTQSHASRESRVWR